MRIGKLAPLFVIIAIASAAAATPPIGQGSAAPEANSPAGLSSSDWSSIRAAYEAGRHKIVAAENGWRARNPGQGWITTFDERGFTTDPDGGGWSWGLDLVGYGWGEPVALAGPVRSTSAEGARLSRDWDGRITEWYVNDRRGLEHGFTIAERPSSAAQPLTLEVAIRGALVPAISSDGRNVSFTNPQGGSALNYSGLTVLDASGNLVGARWKNAQNNRLRLVVEDTSAIYPLTIDPVAQQAYLKASNTGAGDQFGYSVSVSGDTIVIGAPYEDSSAKGVNGIQADDSSDDSGAAYVFTRTGGTWAQQAYLKAANADSGDHFGHAVSISGDTIVIGAYGEDSYSTEVNGDDRNNSASSSGAAYIFTRNAGAWSQQAYLKASNAGIGDLFGWAVSVEGDTVVVGAHREDSYATGVNGNQTNDSAQDSGAAYVYKRNGTIWSQQAYLKASNTESTDFFGASLAISGDTIVVGAYFEDSNATRANGNQSDNSASGAGAAYIFVRSLGVWTQQVYLKPSHVDSGDAFGYSVAISDDTVVIGATGEDSNSIGVNGDDINNSAMEAGAAYVFTRNGGTWTQQAYLKASNTELGDTFGFAVSISGTTILVGAIGEDSYASGVDGSQSGNGAFNSGAAYVFTQGGGTWSQHAYLKASNPWISDRLGWSVSVAGGIAVIGSRYEDSSATGVNADQTNDNAADSGASYVFEIGLAPGWPGLTPFGTGTAGCAGNHELSALSSPQIGNASFSLKCTNPAPLTTGLWLITDAQDLAGSDPFGIGAMLHVGLFTATELITIETVAPLTGPVSVNLPIPAAPGLVGKTYFAQSIWAWPLSACFLFPYGISTSNGLAITIQP